MERGQLLAFGTLLRRYRLAAGLTQDELAERAHISERSIGDIERGVSRAPRRDTVALLATALGLTEHERAAFTAVARHRGDRDAALLPARPHPGHGIVPPFVGRARDLTLLERHLTAEEPPLLMLAGEPGIGKSRVLSEAMQRAAHGGWTVLDGGCQRRGGQESYAPLLGALQSYVRRRSPARLRADLRGCAWLVRLLPELADGPIEPLPAWTLPPEQERRLMWDAVGRFLANVAGPAGTLVALDDLQWAGTAALDLLATLVRTPSAAPLRVVAAYRDTEVQPREALVLLADLAHAGLATQVTLAPLAMTEAAQLFDALHQGAGGRDQGDPAAVREMVLKRAGGVPFFVVSCAHGLRLGEGSAGHAVPWDVTQAVRWRVAALPDGARSMLGAAAVAGRVVARAILVAVATQPEEEVLAALESAVQARLLVEDGHNYQFAHDVIREVIEADVGAARRLVLHRRMAAAIEATYAHCLADHYATLAYHYLHGEAWGPALDYLMKAGDKAVAASATQEALALFAQALALCDTLGSTALATAAEVARKRGSILSDGGDFLGAAAEFERMRAAAARLGDRRG